MPSLSAYRLCISKIFFGVTNKIIRTNILEKEPIMALQYSGDKVYHTHSATGKHKSFVQNLTRNSKIISTFARLKRHIIHI